jgi:hypothetical protein
MSVTRTADGCLTNGKKTIRYGDLVRTKDGRIGEVVFTRLYINVSRPGRYDRFVKHTYQPQVMLNFEGWPPYNELHPFHSLRLLFPE